MNFFVTGTDTGVGKTFFTALLTRALRRAGHDTVALKPISCGGVEDAVALQEAADGVLPLEVINPVALRVPAAPLAAAQSEGVSIDVEKVLLVYREARRQFSSVLVEGVGGWLVPVRHNYSMADLAAEMALPVLVVVRDRLGAINHTLLTVESIRRRGLPCAGLVLNNGSDASGFASNRATLEAVCDVPVLFEIQRGQTALDLAVLK